MAYDPNPENDFELGYGLSVHEDYEMGRLLKGKVRKKLKKAVKAVALGPLKVVHKITHGKNSPIRKMELKLQGVVGKALPFTKPFIQAHNKISETTYKGLEKVGVAKKGETLLANKTQSSLNPVALLQAKQGAASANVAAAQLATSVATKANLQNVLTRENAQMLASNSQFRGMTLAHLVGKARGGNQAAMATLKMLRR